MFYRDKADREQHDQFLRLFMVHEDALRLFIRSLLFNQEESREVMQEVAIVLWRKFDDSLDSPSFRRWAFGVARMEVLAFHRDRARDRHIFGDDIAELRLQIMRNMIDPKNFDMFLSSPFGRYLLEGI